MLISLVSLLLLLLALLLINRWISAHLQGVGMLVSGRASTGQILLYFVLIPGVILHELSHWLMAWLLNLQPSTFRVGLRPTKHGLQLGYVTFRSGGALRDGLVGIAPFFSGSLLLVLVGSSVFEINRLAAVIGARKWLEALSGAWGLLYAPDVWLWVYLIFVVSNSMLPSASDRRPWRIVTIYAALLSGLAYLSGLIPHIPVAWTQAALTALSALATAFGLTVIIDLLFAALILGIERLLSWLRGGSIVYH